nr:MAG: hypothetical protein OI716_00800 [Candidatus Methanoperedens sp.]WAI00087.1 MAG: hypothetical protein OI720_00645 [Candidatus Methanoperedens sp.]
MLASIYRLSLERKCHAEVLQDMPGPTEQEFQEFFLGSPAILGFKWSDRSNYFIYLQIGFNFGI